MLSKYKILILTIVVATCMNQKFDVKEKTLIRNFLKTIVLNEDFSQQEMYKYFNYFDNEKNKIQALNTFVKENIKYVRGKLINKKYHLVTHTSEINFVYDKTKNEHIYHLIIEGEVITTFIVEGDKIKSFFYNMVKGNTMKRTPFILNDR
mgnify:CR=1 FL=1